MTRVPMHREDPEHPTTEARAFAEFQAAFKSVGFYPEGNPVRERMLDTLTDTLVSFPAGEKGVLLALQSDQVQWSGIPVLRRDDDGWDVMVRLFEAGLRQLAFLPHVGRPEIERLLSLLVRTARGELNPTDEDLSVMLWEMDLPSISYRVLDTLEDALPLQMLPELDVEASAEGSEPWRDDDQLWEGLHPLERYLASAGGLDTTDLDARTFQADADELSALCNLVKQEGRRIRTKMVKVLGEVLLLDLSPSESHRNLELVRRFTLDLLHEGRFDTFVQIVRRFRERCADLTGDLGLALQRMSEELSGVEAARRTLAALESSPCDNDKLVVAFLSELRPDGLQVVLDAVAAALEADEGAAAQFSVPAQAVARAMQHRSHLLLARPANLSARDLRALARLMPRQRTSDQAEEWSRQLASLHSSLDPAIRVAALEFLAACRAPNLEKRLVRSLEDEDGQVRLVGARLLSETSGAKALQPLLQALLVRDFEKREFEEQAGLYEALARSSPGEVFALLERTVSRRDWLAPRHWRIQKACALRALGFIPIEHSGALLMKYRDARDPLLAEASRLGLERHRRQIQGPGRPAARAA